ncbi:alpha/beta fold hydrolase [Saccharopolyspora sp. NFXS83]|uniref:alpha/beta fold hydrolase n=1 Tax=Saccharopolyspora sp. NFXS83 TaxID=2993560 RepID=UPI00224A5AC4|nr:alpha/beta fold hydrolase [Saccharopolyspora sp. NFXS83]MCX2729184.1 alpha/beta fold hydrolase [Saccharopolyspora sp. NFXS83]
MRRHDELERFEATSRDGTLVRGVRRPGRGEPVVLIHGVAMDIGVWPESGFFDALPGAELIAFDLRGRGASERVGTAEAHAVDRYVEDVQAVLDAFAHPSCSLFGLYFGGRVGLLTAEVDPRVSRVFSFCAHGERVEIPVDAVEDEAAAIAGGRGHAYLTDHFTAAGAPRWMVSACDRVDRAEVAAATRGLLHGSDRGARRGFAGQELVLITANGDGELDTFQAGARRLGAQLWLVDDRTRVRAAARVAEVGARVAGLLGTGAGG